MKRFVVLLAMLGIGGIAAARADTITLNPAGGFGALHQYHDVSTSEVPVNPVTIYLPQSGYGNTYLYFSNQQTTVMNGDNWYWSGSGQGLQEFYCSGPLVDMGGFYSQVCTATGRTLTLTIQESSRRVCTHSGRGQSCHTVWTLLGGTIVRN